MNFALLALWMMMQGQAHNKPQPKYDDPYKCPKDSPNCIIGDPPGTLGEISCVNGVCTCMDLTKEGMKPCELATSGPFVLVDQPIYIPAKAEAIDVPAIHCRQITKVVSTDRPICHNAEGEQPKWRNYALDKPM